MFYHVKLPTNIVAPAGFEPTRLESKSSELPLFYRALLLVFPSRQPNLLFNDVKGYQIVWVVKTGLEPVIKQHFQLKVTACVYHSAT